MKKRAYEKDQENLRDVAVMVVNWNGRDFLANFLRSLEATRGEISYGVYVVDNASSDGSAHMVRMEFPTVHLIENRENLGFSRATLANNHTSEAGAVTRCRIKAAAD